MNALVPWDVVRKPLSKALKRSDGAKDGTIKDAVLWSPVDIGYAAIYITKAQLDGTLDPSKGFIKAGRLGDLKFTAKDEILQGPPLVFNKDNVGQYNF